MCIERMLDCPICHLQQHDIVQLMPLETHLRNPHYLMRRYYEDSTEYDSDTLLQSHLGLYYSLDSMGLLPYYLKLSTTKCCLISLTAISYFSFDHDASLSVYCEYSETPTNKACLSCAVNANGYSTIHIITMY